jgi:DNA-binding NtrC family response regulator
LQKTRILVIDDDENIRLTITKILEFKGYQVETASTGIEALKKTKESYYNLALVDIQLPDIDGVQLLEQIKHGVPKMRKIIITGFPTMQNAIEALNKRADAYVIKPVEIDLLLAIIEEQLSLQQEEKAFDQVKIAEFIESRVHEFTANHV